MLLSRQFAINGLLATYLAGCSYPAGNNASSQQDYEHTVASAATAIPLAVEIERHFGDADHFITHYGQGFANGSQVWNTEVFFGGRYVLTMQVAVDVDYEMKTLRMKEPPSFKIVEWSKVEKLPDGRMSADSGQGRFFDLDAWKQFHASDGDLSVIGIRANTDHVPGFDELAANVRRDRIRISLLEAAARKQPTP